MDTGHKHQNDDTPQNRAPGIREEYYFNAFLPPSNELLGVKEFLTKNLVLKRKSES